MILKQTPDEHTFKLYRGGFSPSNAIISMQAVALGTFQT